MAFQGEPGAYSEQAVFNYLGNVEALPCESFDLVFDAVIGGACDAGLIPIENSLAGSIHQNYDLLLRHDLHIVGEYPLRVQHCLITSPGVKKEDIKKAISHPQALGQCAAYLRGLGIKPESVYDTAGSVKMLRESGARDTAAIASRRAAEIYDMQIIEEGIEDYPENYTRFLAIAQEPVQPEGEAKTSIVFTLKNQPGSLFKALSVFAVSNFCIFCYKKSKDYKRKNLILYESAHNMVIMNKYPYAPGHLMVIPKRHIKELGELTGDESLDMFDLMKRSISALQKALKAQGFNVGANLGKVAGAGEDGHLHFHVLARWNGDANFSRLLARQASFPSILKKPMSGCCRIFPISPEVISGRFFIKPVSIT